MTLASISRPPKPGRHAAGLQARGPSARAPAGHDAAVARPLSSFPLGAAHDPAEAVADASASRVARALHAPLEASDQQREIGSRPIPRAISDLHFPDRGHSLPASTRRRLEPELGVDLSTVRLHTSAEAGELAHRLSARAFTLGNHIVLGHGSSLQSAAGRQLLAHELGHLPEQARAEPRIRRSPYAVDPALAQQPTQSPEQLPPLEDTQAAMRQLDEQERELYVAAVREWVSACGHGRDLLAAVEALHPARQGPQPADWFPEAARWEVARLSAATIRVPLAVLSVIEVSRRIAAAGGGSQLETPTLDAPSHAEWLEQQRARLVRPPTLGGIGPASVPFGFDPSLLAPPRWIPPRPAKAQQPLATSGAISKFPTGVPFTKNLTGTLDGTGFKITHANPESKHEFSFGASVDVGNDRGIPLPKPTSEPTETEAEAFRRGRLVGGSAAGPASTGEGGPDSFDVTLEIAMTHKLAELSKLSWSAAGGSNGGTFVLTYEFGQSKHTKVVTLDGTVASAAKAAAEFVDETKQTLGEGIGELEEVGKIAGSAGSTVKAFEPLVKPKQVPIFKVSITVQHELRSTADPSAAPSSPNLMNALGGRGDPRYSPLYLDSMSALLGSGHGVTLVMIQFEINF